MNSVTFMDDRTFRVGDRVRFHTGSSWGTGKVIGFGKDGGAVTVKVKADPDAEIGRSDRWPLKTGGYFDRLRDHGIGGGNIQEKLGKNPSKLPVKAGNFHAPAMHKSGWACYRLVQKRTDGALDKQMVFWAPDDEAARAHVPKATFDYATPVRLERALPTDREQADAAWTRSRARRNPSKLPTLSAAAVQAAQAVQDDPEVTRARQALTLFRKRDSGYAQARVIAVGMINDLATEMAAEWQKGRRVSGSWLAKKLEQKKYQRITMTDLFEEWAKLTAAGMDQRSSA